MGFPAAFQSFLLSQAGENSLEHLHHLSPREVDSFESDDENETSDQFESSDVSEPAMDRMGGYGGSGGGYGGNYTLEILGVLLALLFVARVIGDIVMRIRNGRSVERSWEENLNILMHNVLGSLHKVEKAMTVGAYAPDTSNTTF